MAKYHSGESEASDPGMVSLCAQRFRRLEPAAQGLRGWYWRWFGEGRGFEEMLDEHLRLGDSRAACVISIDPLLVAAYTDEIDCVAILSFPPWLVEEHGLKPWSRLLTVNTYRLGEQVVNDLVPGPDDLEQYSDFFPVIADFVSDDQQRIAERKAEILDEEWQRCLSMGREYLREFPGQSRSGSPLQVFKRVV
jgi:hypothetical protein